MLSVGLDYLTLQRSAATLSGGEAQRIRLASQLGSELSGVLYVLDEPSNGLHQRDNHRLIETLRRLRDQGNSVLIVEHDADTMRAADWVVDFGPGAGRYGGQVVFSGTPQRLSQADTLTGEYLSGRRRIEVPKSRRPPRGFLEILGAREHNLKNVSVKFPLGTLTAITGVSGAGKSSLINGILRPALLQELHDSRAPSVNTIASSGSISSTSSSPSISSRSDGRRAPIRRRTPKAFDHIRNLFAELPEARTYGFKPGRFSFNVKGGAAKPARRRTQARRNALPCRRVRPLRGLQGRRYNDATLRVRFHDKSIADVLDLPIVEARELFFHHPQLRPILDTLCDVGLGYLSLGQPANDAVGW